jgi:hypothetical protein
MLSSAPGDKREAEKKAGEEEAKALEQEYKQTHPNGPYPPVVIEKKDVSTEA